LHPGHQQQRGEKVKTQVYIGLGREIRQVGKQSSATHDEHTPKIAVTNKEPDS